MGEVDLDLLASGYTHRPLTSAGAERARAAGEAAGLGPGDLALDVGGGRGWHAAVLARSGARAVVVDRSEAMVAAARREPGVAALVADGAALPVRSDSARLVYFHASIHYGDPERWLAEAVRVAGPGATVWVWTFDPAAVEDSFLARWFPTVGEIDARRFPAAADLAARLERLGVREVARGAAVDPIERRAGDWEAAVRGGFVSTLQLVATSEIEQGLAAFARRHPDPEEVLRYDVRYTSVSGRLPL